MNFSLITTVGPSLLNKESILMANELGNCIFRINGAHVSGAQADALIDQLRSYSQNLKIMIDLPGNKIRTANLTTPIKLIKNQKFILESKFINYPDFYKHLNIGDTIFANDSIYEFEVSGIQDTNIEFLSKSNGELKTNKGLHAKGIHSDIPFLMEKDRELIDVGLRKNISYLSLSFVRNKKDVEEAKILISKSRETKTKLIAKIETLAACKNLEEICDVADILNIDRGDLSTDVGLIQLPFYQNEIVETAIRRGKSIFLATQFLKNMETYPVPLIAEVIDLQKSIRQGISGIQLSEETAVGQYPLECIKLVFEMVQACRHQ